MISIFRRGRVWWVRGSLHGQRIQPRSLDTQYKEVAAKRAAQLQLEESASAGRVITWGEFQTEFLAWSRPNIKTSSHRKYDFVVSRFGQFYGAANSIRDITPKTISDYTAARQWDLHPTKHIPVGREGIKSDLRILRRVFSYAIQAGYIRENPVKVPGLNTAPGKTQPFSKDEISAMLNDRLAMRRPDLRAKIAVFVYTGLRISDVASLKKSSVKNGYVTVRTSKRGTDVSISLHNSLRESLEAHLKALTPQQDQSPYLFATKRGKRLWPQSLDAELRRLWARVGIEGGHAHRFRDTFAVALLEQGASLYDVAKLLGNSVGVVERHYAPYVRELRERGARLVSGINF